MLVSKMMRNCRFRILICFGLLTVFASIAWPNSRGSFGIDLSGDWQLALDAGDTGIKEKWFASSLDTEEIIKLPGSLQEQGFGEKPSVDTNWTTHIGAALLEGERFQRYTKTEDFKSPFWLTPSRHYIGPAWYQRTVEIPDSWQGQRITLYLERPHWQTKVWINGEFVGSSDSLGVPHEFTLTDVIEPGRQQITIRVDNRVHVPVGDDAHSVSDQTQTNWNGIIGQLHLKAKNPDAWFEDIQIYPDIDNHKVGVSVVLGASVDKIEGELSVSAFSFNTDDLHEAEEETITAKLEPGEAFEFDYYMGTDVQLWDEFSPSLYRLELEFESSDGKTLIHSAESFGMREISIEGTQFAVNHRPVFLRGTLECCIFPKTGYPPMDKAEWIRIINIAKSYGLNHFRFHSWCPPKAAFEAADELGFYLQAEGSTWATFGDGTAVDTWIYDECHRMLKEYGNHPSFILMSPGNEPHGTNRDAFLGKLVNHLGEKDSRRFYTAGAGWPLIPENQFHIAINARLQRFAPLRLSDRPQTAADYTRFVRRYDAPVISHEIGQWCAYPNLSEHYKYDGSLYAGNIEIARNMLKEAGMMSLAQDFMMASGKFQTLLYKAEIEAALRTPDMAGFQLLDLRDFPGQGMAPVGVLDSLWQNKGYTSSEEFLRFCQPTVPLARMRTRVFTNDQTFEAEIDVANYGQNDLAAKPQWKIRDQAGRVLISGDLHKTEAPAGQLTSLGDVSVPLNEFVKPKKLMLEVSFKNTDIVNDWNFWVYPEKLEPLESESQVRIVNSLDNEETISALKAGATVLLLPESWELKGDTLGSFEPIFWNRITFVDQQIHTMGILCDPRHPALQHFPTDFHSNWQWWELLENSKPIILDELPGQIEPVVRVIDDWNLCRSLGLIFEASIGSGKILVCSMDISNNLENRPVARQLRHSLISYIDSDDFFPKQRLSVKDIKGLFRDPSMLESLSAEVIYTSSEEDGNAGKKAIDGNPNTMWHSAWTSQRTGYPHEIQIELEKSVYINGFKALPRQDGNRNGWIEKYRFYVSEDAQQWGEPAASGEFSNNAEMKTVQFEEPTAGRFVRFVAISGFRDDHNASLSKLDILTE